MRGWRERRGGGGNDLRPQAPVGQKAPAHAPQGEDLDGLGRLRGTWLSAVAWGFYVERAEDLILLAVAALGAAWGSWMTLMISLMVRQPERPEPTQRVYLLTPMPPDAELPDIPELPGALEGDEWRWGRRPDGTDAGEELM